MLNMRVVGCNRVSTCKHWSCEVANGSKTHKATSGVVSTELKNEFREVLQVLGHDYGKSARNYDTNGVYIISLSTREQLQRVVAAFSQWSGTWWRQRVGSMVGGCRARPGPRSTSAAALYLLQALPYCIVVSGLVSFSILLFFLPKGIPHGEQ